jgi:hypothetical protein
VIRRAREPDDRREGLFDQAGRELAGVARELRILSRVGAERARQRWRRRLDRAWTELWVAAATTTAVVAGVLLVAIGLVRLLGIWLGRWPGVGECLGGLALLAGAWIVSSLRRRSRDQAEVRRLERAYERLGGPPETGSTAQVGTVEGAHVHEDRGPARAR